MRELWNAYLFILIPFVMLCVIKVTNGNISDVLLSTDWSIASIIIFAQSLSSVPKVIVKSKQNINGDELTSYIIKVLFVGILPSFYLYFLMHTEPSFGGGVCQIIMFVYASWRFFVDGRKVQIFNQHL